jgi:hypothetical protein
LEELLLVRAVSLASSDPDRIATLSTALEIWSVSAVEE